MAKAGATGGPSISERDIAIEVEAAQAEAMLQIAPKFQQIECLTELGTQLDKRLKGYVFSARDYLNYAVLRIRDRLGCQVPLLVNRSQRLIASRWARKNIVLKARQLGITTYVAARFFVDTITRPGSLTVLVAHDKEAAEEIFRIVHRFQENLPGLARKGPLATSRINAGQLIYPKLDCEFRVETAGDENAGRGLTITNLHCSEVARWPREGAEALTALRAAVTPKGQVVLESTPNGAGGCFYQEWQQAKRTGYRRHFLPWWTEKEYIADAAGLGELSDEEHALVHEHSLSLEQIAFRREIRANFRELARQEFAEDSERCFLSSNECVFDLEALQKRLREIGSDMEEPGSSSPGGVQTWLPPQGKRTYIIGVDPSGGGSRGDFACADVIDRFEGLQCAELRGHFDPRQLAKRLVSLAESYNNALIAVERNNHGHAVLAHLQMLGYQKLYSQCNQLGWLTSAVSRPSLIENLAEIIAQDAAVLNSPTLLRECKSFVRHQDGSASATAGAHDDCVMAIGIAYAVRREMAGR